MINDLFSLAQDNGPIGERARIALQLTEQFNKQEISADEYQELMMDLTRLDEVTDQASSIEMKTMLVTAIYAVAQLA
jgi:hypothetical protein